MKGRQNIPQRVGVFRIYAARVVLFKKPLQPLVADCPYHVTRHVAHVNNKTHHPMIF
jgi:hypothetical protein